MKFKFKINFDKEKFAKFISENKEKILANNNKKRGKGKKLTLADLEALERKLLGLDPNQPLPQSNETQTAEIEDIEPDKSIKPVERDSNGNTPASNKIQEFKNNKKDQLEQAQSNDTAPTTGNSEEKPVTEDNGFQSTGDTKLDRRAKNLSNRIKFYQSRYNETPESNELRKAFYQTRIDRLNRQLDRLYGRESDNSNGSQAIGRSRFQSNLALQLSSLKNRERALTSSLSSMADQNSIDRVSSRLAGIQRLISRLEERISIQ